MSETASSSVEQCHREADTASVKKKWKMSTLWLYKTLEVFPKFSTQHVNCYKKFAPGSQRNWDGMSSTSVPVRKHLLLSPDLSGHRYQVQHRIHLSILHHP